MSIGTLIPRPGHSDYLISAGSRALISERPQSGWPFSLAVYAGRQPVGVALEAHRLLDGAISITASGRAGDFRSIDLSLFVRACIRRSEGPESIIYWPTPLTFEIGDPLAQRAQAMSGRMKLEAGYVDLRPSRQAPLAAVYRKSLDIPWLYDPLDYEVMIPLLTRPHIRRVLDLGCGSGRNAVPLENAGYEVHGVESAPESLAICHAFVGAPERFHRASAVATPFPDAYFDAVLDVGCLHMLPTRDERKTVLIEMARILRPGGVLCGRALTPRDSGWLSAQPFEAIATGFNPEEFCNDAQVLFEARILGQTDHLAYYLLLKIA